MNRFVFFFWWFQLGRFVVVVVLLFCSAQFWCHFKYERTLIFIFCSIHPYTYFIYRCYMSISQEFIALFERVRNVAELIKRFFVVYMVYNVFFLFYFWFATQRFMGCCFLLFACVFPFLSFGHRHFLAFIALCVYTCFFGCAKRSFLSSLLSPSIVIHLSVPILAEHRFK